MKRTIFSPFVKIDASVYMRLNLRDFVDLTNDRELLIIYINYDGPSVFFSQGHYYFAFENGVAFYTRIEEPDEEIVPDIEAESFLLSLGVTGLSVKKWRPLISGY